MQSILEMCAQFILKAKLKDLVVRFGAKPDPGILDSIDLRARGFIKTDQAPVLVFEEGEIQLRLMHFSLCPSWSQEFPHKWSSYNARMSRPKGEKSKRASSSKSSSPVEEMIFQIPSWRDPFSKGRTCLVPMNAAIESSYFGDHKGEIIQIANKDDSVFYCAGIWDRWLNKETGEVKDGFALITDDPYPFVFKVGHDRSVLLLNIESGLEWLKNQKWNAKERFEFLKKNRIDIDWKSETERKMAKGWEKRAPTPEEISSIRVWEQSS
jgi:putative SOS response-associated peptidase YedK